MANVTSRVQQHRERLRLAGFRPVQLWVPDTRRPEFLAECKRQSLLVAQLDPADMATQALMLESLADIEGWE